MPCAGMPRTRSNSPKTFLMVPSASSHNCRNVSRAPAPFSNSLRIRSRCASTCGPSSASGVTGFSSIFLLGGRKLGTRPVRGEDIGILQSAFAAFLVANPDCFVNPAQEYLTVSDFPCLGALEDRFHGAVHSVVRQHQLQLDLR